MDFSNERYVRLYVRDTTSWKLLKWEGQTVWTLLYRKADRSGVISLDGLEPWEAATLHCDLPEEVSKPGMERCLARGWVVRDGDRLVFPKYIEANETPMSDAQRARESRGKRAALSQNVTAPSQNVTDCHAESHGVTPSHTASLLTVPSVPAVPSQNSERELKPFLSVSSVAPARVEQDLGQSSDRESDKRRGSDFMLQATVLSWQGFDHELALIGAKPERERAVAIASIRGDPWCQANIKRCDPKHVLRKWNAYSSGNQPMQLAKNETSDSQTWRSRVQQSTQKLEELHDRRSKLQRSDVNYASTLYDIDKAIREETERLERRKRELHALTG